MSKRFRLFGILFLTVVLISSLLFVVACKPSESKYTVTFKNGENTLESVEVPKGKKVPECTSPVLGETSDHVFDYWYYVEKDRPLMESDRVISNMTLSARFIRVTRIPDNISMSTAPFSSEITWLQRDIKENSTFVVSLYKGIQVAPNVYDYDVTPTVYSTVFGGENNALTFSEYRGHNDIFEIKFSPEVIPQGGVYKVDVRMDGEGTFKTDLLFKGAGIVDNPYLIYNASDMSEVVYNDVARDKYYELMSSFDVSVSYVQVKEFNGVFNGNGYSLNLTASDSALFGTLGENGVVEDLVVSGAVKASSDCSMVGSVANINMGQIKYVTSSVNVTNDMNGVVGDESTLMQCGAGGIVGNNLGTVTNCTSSGTVKANVGGGGIAAVNNGKISLSKMTGTIGAGNNYETGASLNAYSFSGGIVGVNNSVIEKCALTAGGKVLAQRALNGESRNIDLGGIAGKNSENARITECFYDGIRVYGQSNIGGIAGENDGEITYCYAGATYNSSPKLHTYIGGSHNVGGIAGKIGQRSAVSNCFVLSNVYAYESNTAYSVAERANDCVYIGKNFDEHNVTVTSKGSESTNAVSLSVPTGTNNLQFNIENEVDLATKKINLPDSFLPQLNGSDSVERFVSGVRLAWEEQSIEQTHELAVKLVNGNVITEIGTVDSVSGNSVLLEKPLAAEGEYFVGWAVSPDGDPIFKGNVSVGYSQISAYGINGIVQLYAVFKTGEEPRKDLVVAIHSTGANGTVYVSEEQATALKNDFERYAGNSDLDIEFYLATNMSVDDFVSVVGGYSEKVDVVIGGKNLGSKFGSALSSVYGSKPVALNGFGDGSRYVAVMAGEEDRQYAKTFYAFMLNIEIRSAELTLKVGEKTESFVLDSLEGNAAAIDTSAENKIFKGWATTENGEIAIEAGVALNYQNVSSLLKDGSLTLYAVYEQGRIDLTVAIQTGALVEDDYKTITKEDIEKIKSGFNGYLQDLSIENAVIEWLIFDQSSVTDANAAIKSNSAVDVYIGSGNMDSSKYDGVALSNDYKKANVTGIQISDNNRRVGILNGRDNNLYARHLYAFLIGAVYAEAEVTVYIGEANDITVINSVINNEAALPVVELPVGKIITGWSIGSEDAVILPVDSQLNYSTLKNYIVGGKVVLRAVVEQGKIDLTVAIQTGALNSETDDYLTLCKSDIETIKNSFLQYLEQRSMDSVVIIWKIFDQSKVGEANAAISADSSVDIYIGSAKMDSESDNGVSLSQKFKKANIKDGFITTSNRRVAILEGREDNILARHMYGLLVGTTYEAATVTLVDGSVSETSVLCSILNDSAALPDSQAPDGKKLIGWSVSEGSQSAEFGVEVTYDLVQTALDAERKVTLYAVYADNNSDVTYDLTVAVHSSASSTVYITEEEIETLKSAFSELYPEIKIKWIVVSGTNASGFVNSVSSDESIDIVVCGNSTSGLIFSAEADKTKVAEGHFANNARYVGVLDQSTRIENAKKLYEYLTQTV